MMTTKNPKPLENTKPRFKEEQISEIIEWFDENAKPFMINDDEPINVITIEQLVTFLDLRKFPKRSYHYPSYAEIMDQAEKLKVGATRILTREQFLFILLEWILVPNIKHELLLAFQALDTEKRSFLDVNELKLIMTSFGDAFTDVECAELLRDADVKGDGYVFYNTFIENLFSRFPELYELQTEYLYLEPGEDPSNKLLHAEQKKGRINNIEKKTLAKTTRHNKKKKNK